MSRAKTRTGGRAATTGVIEGGGCLSVGLPDTEPPSGWKWTKLTEVARLETGHTPSRRHPEYWGGEVPWIGIKDATHNHGRTIFATNEFTNELGIENSSARILPANTVCLSRTASVGYVVVMGKPMATSQDFVNWVCSDQIHHLYLKYILLSENKSFSRFASGTTHQTIYFPEVKAFHVCLPPRPEQDSIVEILSSMDEQIELNRKQNQTLEAIAQTLFKRWFVEFEFPDENGSPYKSSGGAMQPSKLGEIPAGWEVTPLQECFDFLEGPGIRNWQYVQEGTRFINIRLIKGMDIDISSANCVSEDEANGKYAHFQLAARDVVISTSGTLGKQAIVRKSHIPLLLNTSVIRFRPLEPFTFGFMYCYLNSLAFKEELLLRASGSVQLNFGPTHLKQISLISPPSDLLEMFAHLTEPLMDKVIANLDEIDTLSNIRDTLLPKLMSGELRVA